MSASRDCFNLQMHRAECTARLQNTPHCPVRFDEIVEMDAVFYGVNWTSRGGASKTMKLDATVTNLSTGRSMGFEDIIRKALRSGSAQYTLTRRGTWTGRTAASHALATLAARHTEALSPFNPVTGPAFAGVSA